MSTGKPADIVIVARGRDLNGNIVITYFIKGESDLKRIKLQGDDK